MKTAMLVLLLVLVLVGVVGCAAPKVFVEPLAPAVPTVPVGDFAVLDAAPAAPQSYTVLARISVAGAEPAYPTARGLTRLENTLRAEAATLGADAVVVVRDYGVGGTPASFTGLPRLHAREALAGRHRCSHAQPTRVLLGTLKHWPSSMMWRRSGVRQVSGRFCDEGRRRCIFRHSAS